MQHPFSKILAESDGDHLNQEADGQSRREAMQTVLQVGVGAVAAGVAGTASAQITTQAIGEEGGPRPSTAAAGEEGSRPPAITRAGPGHPEHGGKLPGRPPAVTKAGPAHPEHAGAKVRSAMADLAKAVSALKKNKWSEAAESLTKVRKLSKPKDDKFGQYARLQKHRKGLEKKLNGQITKALDKADKQAKAGDLVPALKTYRKVKGLDEHYGFATRVEKALAEMAKHKDYKVALKKVEALEAKEKPRATTLALGEEGASTAARGEEGGATTKKRGEEGGATTKAIGEEGGKPPIRKTTLALGEEGGGRSGGVSTEAAGEEGAGKIRPVPPAKVTSLAIGEEG